MRPILLLAALALPLAGCQSMRNAAGAYSRFAEKGINVGSPPADSGQAGTPQTATTAAPAAKPAAPPLPGGLVGDGQKHVYAEPIPRSS